MKSGKQIYIAELEAERAKMTAPFTSYTSDSDLCRLRDIDAELSRLRNEQPRSSPVPQDARELPDSIRVPLHQLQADMRYLFGRAAADSSCANVMAESVLAKLAELEAALAALATTPPSLPEGAREAGLIEAAKHLTASADQIKGQAEKLRAVGTDECNEQAGELEIIEPCLRAEANYLRARATDRSAAG